MIVFKTNSQKRTHVDRFGQTAVRIQHVVEAWIGGVPFIHDCDSAEAARELVIRMTQVMGVFK